MTCRMMGCSLCPHALFSQAQSQLVHVQEGYLGLQAYTISKPYIQYVLLLYVGYFMAKQSNDVG